METILRITLLRWFGRALTPAWLAVLALAVCGTLTSAVDHGREWQTSSELLQVFGEESAAPQDRRTVVQVPSNKEAKHGPAGNADAVLPSRVLSVHRLGVRIGVSTDSVLVYKRRLVSSALARAPPR